MNILCLDCATKVSGYAIFKVNILKEYGLIKSKKNETNPHIRIEEMYNQIKKIIKDEKIEYIVLEDSFLLNNVDVMKQLCRLQGSIISLCYDYNIGFYMFLPSEWRKKLEFKGKNRQKQKTQAIDYVNNKYNFNLTYKKDSGDDDIAEAICIGESFNKIINIKGA